jgi:phosphoglycerate kinase
VGIASFSKESAIGFLVEKECLMLSKVVNNPKRPFIAILGGAKVSDKIEVIDNLIKEADRIIIGGGMAYTFLKAKGVEVGKSLLEMDKVVLAKEYLDRAEYKIFLPLDTAISSEYKDNLREEVIGDIPKNKMGLDIGTQSIFFFTKALKGAKTIF